MANNWKDIIYLIQDTHERDIFGIDQGGPVERKVRANSFGTTATEFHEAGKEGLKVSDRTFVIPKRKYKGEQKLRYNGDVYSIYRTYPPSEDEIELHCATREGDSSEQEESGN